MIFVTVGTNEAPFDRLLQMVDGLGRSAELVVQYGASSVRPAAGELHDFLPFEDVVDHVRRARAVVTHAGVGSVIVALTGGKRPIVVARLHRHGEAVDDHQVDFAARFQRAGLVTVVETADELERALAESSELGSAVDRSSPLAAELRSFISGAIARRRG
jgi:UDP-N-acetylglucosamine transferase subunit ALG13